MHISYQPLWDTLKERGMRKEDLRLAAGLTSNMIANMGKGEHISMKTLLRICGTLNCDIADVIALEQDESPTDIGPAWYAPNKADRKITLGVNTGWANEKK